MILLLLLFSPAFAAICCREDSQEPGLEFPAHYICEDTPLAANCPSPNRWFSSGTCTFPDISLLCGTPSNELELFGRTDGALYSTHRDEFGNLRTDWTGVEFESFGDGTAVVTPAAQRTLVYQHRSPAVYELLNNGTLILLGTSTRGPLTDQFRIRYSNNNGLRLGTLNLPPFLSLQSFSALRIVVDDGELQDIEQGNVNLGGFQNNRFEGGVTNFISVPIQASTNRIRAWLTFSEASPFLLLLQFT